MAKLSREEILALPAGPDLDALVAEAMGLRVTIGDTSHKGQVIAWPEADKSGVAFAPSTDVLTAWHMLHYFGGWNVTRNWGRYFVDIHHKTGNYTAYDPSFPLAACRVALLAAQGPEPCDSR